MAHPSSSTTLPVLLLVLGVASGPVASQSLARMADPIAQSDLLYFADQTEAAYELLLAHVREHPDDYAALWRAARAGVVSGVAVEDDRERDRYLASALEHAHRAVALRPHGIDGLYWRGVAAGQRAMHTGSGDSVDLAQIVYDDAHAILATDSLHGGAHNMLGKLNYEVMTLSRFERALARLFMGNPAINGSSWEKAERHLTKAVEVSPDFVLFRFDLGQLYRQRDRDAEAVAHLEAALRLPPAQPIDATIQERAAALLEEMAR